MRQKKYYIQTKRKECMPFDEWITKLEMRAFGWSYKGVDVRNTGIYTLSFNWDNKEAYIREGKDVSIMFKRIRPYGGGCLFSLLESVMSFQSWIRRKLIGLLFGLVLILIAIGLYETCATAKMGEGLIFAIGIMAFLYIPSLITATFGFILRKAGRLDKKLKINLERNGYDSNQKL